MVSDPTGPEEATPDEEATNVSADDPPAAGAPEQEERHENGETAGTEDGLGEPGKGSKEDKSRGGDLAKGSKPESAGGENAGEAGDQRKVNVCHKGKTLAIGAPAQAAHLRHGDEPGACG